MFRDRVKEMAVNHPDMKASEILANVEMLMDNPGPLGLKDESLMRYVQRVRSKQAKGEMGFKKVTYHRKKGYRWGTTASGLPGSIPIDDESSPDKKGEFGVTSGQDFQPSFLEHVRHSQEEEEHQSDDDDAEDDILNHAKDNHNNDNSFSQHLMATNNSELRRPPQHNPDDSMSASSSFQVSS